MTGILVPMQEEIELILHEMSAKKPVMMGNRIYYQGLLFGKPCVTALSRIGKVASAVTAAHMIQHFGVTQMLVAGVAGSLQSDIHIGDIVVGTEAVQHDMDASPIFPRYEIPLLGITRFQSETALSEKAVKAAETISNQQTEYPTKVHKGLIVSGDQFIKTHEQQQEILHFFPEALCVEMEGASVAQVCYEYQVPFCILRVISDHAGESSAMEFNTFILDVARHYTLAMVKHFLA